jgi:D-3-phosphoglycerate dehydrogenase
MDSLEVAYTYNPTIKAGEIIKAMTSHEVLVVRSKIRIDRAFMEANPQLKLIVRAGSGMDNIDLDEADKRGITCVNAPEANCDAVGEQTVGMLLALAHKIVKGNREVVKTIWDREGNRGFEIGDKTVGIIGYGHTGSAVARKLSGFGCKIMAYDKYKEGFETDRVEEVRLERILQEADVVSFHVPLTSETYHWIANDLINRFKKPVVLLNLSRGKIMKTEDVVTGLESGKILAFGADVLENENLDKMTIGEQRLFDRLNEMENVVLTPHVGGWSTESYMKISKVLSDKVTQWLHSKKKAQNPTGRNKHFVG